MNHLQYEMSRLNNLLSCFDQYENEVTVEKNPGSIKLLLNSISVSTTKLSKYLICGFFTVFWPKINLKIVLICDLDDLISHYLANKYSSHNEVERIQSYVWDAICDRGSLEWKYKGEFDGLMEHETL